MAIPILVFEGIFVIYPIIKAVRTSFRTDKLGTSDSFTLANYNQMLFHDPIFWQVLATTLEYTFVVVVLVLLVGLGIGLLMNWAFAGRAVARGILAIPWAIPDVPTVLTFALMLDPNFGVVNAMLRWIPGMNTHQAWLTSPHLAFLSIVLITVWKGFPFYALIILSALQNVPEELIEAAKVEGAGAFRRFRSVTWPTITPTIALLAVLAYIFSMQQFSLIFLSTGGGPGNDTTTLAVRIYNEAFQFFNYDYASALAVIGLILSLIGTAFFIIVQRRITRSRG